MLLMGIDGGGTSCRALLCGADLAPLGRGRSGAANIVTDFEGARAHVIEAATQALAEAGLPPDALGETCAFLGLAGANGATWGKLHDHARRMAPALPFERTKVDTDSRIALQGALGDDDGTVAIIGTGSIFVTRRGGRLSSVGGWGFLVGDTASGARLGQALLQETLLAHDHVRIETPLTRRVMARFDGDPEALVEYAHPAIPGNFAAFAPLIFEFLEKGDPVARGIVEAALDDLEEILAAIDKTHPGGIFSFQGGLGRVYAGLLREDWAKRLRPPLASPVEGAAMLAKRHFAGDAA